MDVKVIEINDTTGVFDITGVQPAFLNGLRRMLLSHVPKLAIDDVTIYDNTGALFDEMVAHRLGQLPVPTDLTMFVRRSECTCEGEGCPNCTVLFTLSKEGPATVYSGDLVPAADAKFKIVDPKIPIVKLLEGQRLMMECGAVLGSGIEHAKWQCVTAVGYQEYPTIKVGDAPLPQAALEHIQRTAPAGVVAIENNRLKVLDPVKAVAYVRSVQDLYDLDIQVSYDTNRWVFRLETDGSLAPAVALRKAANLLMDKLKEVETEIPNLRTPEQLA